MRRRRQSLRPLHDRPILRFNFIELKARDAHVHACSVAVRQCRCTSNEPADRRGGLGWRDRENGRRKKIKRNVRRMK